MTGSGEAALFWIAGPVMVLGALGLIFIKRSVYAALSMALVMILMGIVYLVQGADFLGIIQIFVYSGAVMMLFVFTIMLIGVDSTDDFVSALRSHRWVGLLLAAGLAAILVGAIGSVAFEPAVGLEKANATGNVPGIAALIFGKYVWVFEVTSALLITAALAAMVLAHRERLLPRPTQKEWAAQRIRDNRHVAGLPAPGVYARHNAVDTPALLPDGSVSELSVSRVLRARAQVESPDTYLAAKAETSAEIEESSRR